MTQVTIWRERANRTLLLMGWINVDEDLAQPGRVVRFHARTELTIPTTRDFANLFFGQMLKPPTVKVISVKIEEVRRRAEGPRIPAVIFRDGDTIQPLPGFIAA